MRNVYGQRSTGVTSAATPTIRTATVNNAHEHGRSHLNWISDRISGVLEPLAAGCGGWPAETIRPILAHAWRREFACDLGEPGLSDTAAAIHDRRPWTDGLWTDGF